MHPATLRTLLVTIPIAGFVGAVGFVTLMGGEPQESIQGRAPDHVIQRGEYLVKIMGCNDCHTPWKLGPQGPEPDMTRMLSGHPESVVVPPVMPRTEEPWAWAGTATNTAFTGPWGISFTANLTPDSETGLGKWTPETFI